jgi:predicted transcriptional regulator
MGEVDRARAYTVYMVRREPSAVLSVRVTRELNRRLAMIARRRRQSRSEAARAILATALIGDAADPAKEARRQSRLASRRVSEREVLEFIATAADVRGWR